MHASKYYPLGNLHKSLEMEPLVGIEPTTYSLRMNCSTPELQRRLADVADKTKAYGDPQAGNPRGHEMGGIIP